MAGCQASPRGAAANGGSWAELKTALATRVQEVKRCAYLCADERSKSQFSKELAGLDASVRGLEQLVARIRARLKGDKDAMPRVEALLRACQAQAADVAGMAANLPTHLPTAVPKQAPPQVQCQQTPQLPAQQSRDALRRSRDGPLPGAQPSSGSEPAPRWYVTESELRGVAAYMRGRLTLERLNAALDDLAGFADAHARATAAVRVGAGTKLAPADRKRALDLAHSVANREGIKGQAWFLEADLKDGLHIKLDKSGRGVLTLLRHLGRLAEQRCSVDGVATTVYVLQHPPTLYQQP